MGIPYRAGVSADDIVLDGWSRSFPVAQTLDELHSRGFLVCREAVLQMWADYDAAAEADALRHPIYEPIPHADDVPGQYF